MLNKKGEETSFQFTIGLVITVIILFGLSSCAYKVFNPSCDPNSVDAFNDFVKYYEECISKVGEDCGKFDYSKLDKLDNIVVEPTGNKLESTSVNLRCNGKTSFRNSRKIDVKLCFTDNKEDIIYSEVDDFLQLSINPDLFSTKSTQYVGALDVNLYNIKKQPCFLSKFFERATLFKQESNLFQNNHFKENNEENFVFNGREYYIKIKEFKRVGDKYKKADILIKPRDESGIINLLDLTSGTKTKVDLDLDKKEDIELYIEISEVAYKSMYDVSAIVIISHLNGAQDE